MGNKQSTKDKEQVEWRKINWKDKDNLLKTVKEFQPANKNIKHVRIMLHGPIGSGKSSFINTVSSVLRGKMVQSAIVATGSGRSFTQKVQTHKIQIGNTGSFHPFVFTDLMGLESEEKDGIHEEDIKLALKGHIKDHYTFNPVAPIESTSSFFNTTPAPEDKTHVLVSIIPADKVKLMPAAVIKKIKQVRRAASDLDIPQICIITMIDKVSGDLRCVYKMKDVKETMEAFSDKSEIPMNCIFAVKNYHEEDDLDNDTDILILRALKRIVDDGEDFTNERLKM